MPLKFNQGPVGIVVDVARTWHNIYPSRLGTRGLSSSAVGLNASRGSGCSIDHTKSKTMPAGLLHLVNSESC